MIDSYTVLAEFYDSLTTDVPYIQWADYIEAHFRQSGCSIRSIAELGCGTGSLAAILAKRGYSLIATDISPDMLTAAQSKCCGLDVQLVCQDMSALALPFPVDCVICCLDSLNYLTQPVLVRRTFQKVFSALKAGGIFIFDIKTPLALEKADGQIYLDENDELFCVWRGEYDANRRICSYGIDLFGQNGDGSWWRDGELHEEYAYTLSELSDWLSAVGFTSIRQYGNLSQLQPTEQEERVFFIARKDM